jgi:hypothetical protein
MHLTHDGVHFGATLNMAMNRLIGRGYGSWRHLLLAYGGEMNMAIGE